MAIGYYYDEKTGRYEWGEEGFTTPELRYEDNTDLSAVGGMDKTPGVISSRIPEGKGGRNSEAFGLLDNESAGSDGVGQSAASSGKAAGLASAGQQIISGGSPIDAAGSGMTSAGAASANPYLVAAGLGVSALSSIQKGKNQREQNRYAAEMQKYNARQSAINKMAQLGAGLKA